MSQYRLQWRAERPGMESTWGVMNKSHSPWTFLWRYRGSDMEPFHVIAPKCPGVVRNSDTCKWICCICGLCCVCVWIHCNPVDHTPGIFIHPPETYILNISFSKRCFFSSKASMVSACQMISLPVQIMTVIKQLGPERQIGQELASFSHLNIQQMRIQWGIQTLWLWHLLAPFGTDSYCLAYIK